MPIFGVGLHVVIAIFFAIHVVRSGQQIFWLFILFSFPLLGSLVYFVAVYLPDSRLERGGRKTVAAVAKSLDPERELREARAAFEYTPTAQNQMRFAHALLEAGAAEDAAINYEACLRGPFSNDLEIKFCAARAFVESGRYTAAIDHLETIRARDAHFRPEQVSLLYARALAGAGRAGDAKGAFEEANTRFGSFEVKAEYAIWAARSGDRALASAIRSDLDQAIRRWDKHTRALNMRLLQRLNEATGK